ncbi:hypothetical protein K504DRAFT_157449 [Pleomassaria siparia CBS 279.74]|uniref:Uncharacterized protein n=1 Tax=Pleomassaria siparia CBS 279.74 TaxID=1314801 RepID=A0A6G1KP48_9PLEO|nr:hypothetical protein K504DRAFT_157449 [Pleomassaria siparia CBS 279.74]
MSFSRNKIKPFEEIDLTASSPEPEPEPTQRRIYKPEPESTQRRIYKPEPESTQRRIYKPESAYSHRHRAHVNAEAKPLAYRRHPTPYAHKTSQRPSNVKRAGAVRERDHHPNPQVHPDHLARIINTSNPQAVREVLLNLCKLSPALSGAVARGLAHSSTFAQATIKKYHPTPNIKADPGRRAPSVSSESDDFEPLSSSRIPYLKHERKPSPTPSHRSSSTAFSDMLLLKPTTSFDKPRSPLGSTSRSALEHREAQGSAIAHTGLGTELTTPTMTCRQCQKPFEHKYGFCSWHTGRLTMTAHGFPRYSCCDAPVDAEGCESATAHVAASASKSPMKPTTQKTGSSGVTKYPSTKTELRSRKVCVKCQQQFDEGFEDNGCSFHPGTKVMNDERAVEWTCCGYGPREAGCQFEDFHVTADAQGARKRTPSYESSSFPRIKAPRLF